MKNIIDKRGINFPFPTGISSIDNDLSLNGIIKKETYVGLIAPGGVGKTSFIFQTCLLEPYLHAVKENKKIRFIYFSYEMSKEVLIARTIVYFLAKEYKIDRYEHNGKTHRIGVSYILGDIPKDKKRKEPIPINRPTLDAIDAITKKYIEPLFGKFDSNWNQIEEGLVTLYNDPDTAKGVYFTAINYARNRGKVVLGENVIKDKGKVIKKTTYIDHYEPFDNSETVVMIIDHLRLLKLSKGELRKQSMDKLSRDCIKLRDIFKFGIISIGHTNRNKEDTNTFKFRGDTLYYEASDQKDTGCYGEDCDSVISLFNPNDDAYNLNTYFGLKLSNFKNLIGVHFVKGRTSGDKHRVVEFDGASGIFYTPKQLKK